jgi:hypothetical protein
MEEQERRSSDYPDGVDETPDNEYTAEGQPEINSTVQGTTIRTKDERYYINLIIETDEGEETTKLYYNPTDSHFFEYLAALEKISDIDVNLDGVKSVSDVWERTKPLIETVDLNFDGIFGVGTSRKVFRYNGSNFKLLSAIINEMMNKLDFVGKQAARRAKEKRAEIQSAAQQEFRDFIKKT